MTTVRDAPMPLMVVTACVDAVTSPTTVTSPSSSAYAIRSATTPEPYQTTPLARARPVVVVTIRPCPPGIARTRTRAGPLPSFPLCPTASMTSAMTS